MGLKLLVAKSLRKLNPNKHAFKRTLSLTRKCKIVLGVCRARDLSIRA